MTEQDDSAITQKEERTLVALIARSRRVIRAEGLSPTEAVKQSAETAEKDVPHHLVKMATFAIEEYSAEEINV